MSTLLVFILALSILCTSSLTVSGFSGGAYFSTQFHVAYSQSISGVGVIAGGPYWCTQSSNKMVPVCLGDPHDVSLADSIAYAEKASANGEIDNVSNLASAKVYIFSGTQDTVVNPGVVNITYQFYKHFVTTGSIVFKHDMSAPHAWITDSYGTLCSTLQYPYLNNCGFDMAGAVLNQLYSGLQPKVPAISANLLRFQQGDYGNREAAELAEYGYVYVPNGCKTTRCEVHLNFHACTTSAELIGDYFVVNNGLNDWAESNNIVVIYPQVHTNLFHGNNPYGCFDVVGYTGSHYAVQKGKQMDMVMAMAKNPPETNWT
jgi:poly(3-hydroxybutyrate) depolymerase